MSNMLRGEIRTEKEVKAYQVLTEQLELFAYEQIQNEGEVKVGHYMYELIWNRDEETIELCVNEISEKAKKVCGYSF